MRQWQANQSAREAGESQGKAWAVAHPGASIKVIILAGQSAAQSYSDKKASKEFRIAFNAAAADELGRGVL